MVGGNIAGSARARSRSPSSTTSRRSSTVPPTAPRRCCSCVSFVVLAVVYALQRQPVPPMERALSFDDRAPLPRAARRSGERGAAARRRPGDGAVRPLRLREDHRAAGAGRARPPRGAGASPSTARPGSTGARGLFGSPRSGGVSASSSRSTPSSRTSRSPANVGYGLHRWAAREREAPRAASWRSGWASPSSSTAGRASSPEASASGWRWRGRSRRARGCSCWTSRSPRSTPRPARRCAPSCAACWSAPASRRWSSPTIGSRRSRSATGWRCMVDGAVRQVGPVHEVFGAPADVEVARVVGTENVLPVRLRRPRRRAGRGRAGSVELVARRSRRAGGDDAYACIRAEEVVLEDAPEAPPPRRATACPARSSRRAATRGRWSGSGSTAASRWSRSSPAPSAERLGLAPGRQVPAIVKAPAVRLVGR